MVALGPWSHYFNLMSLWVKTEIHLILAGWSTRPSRRHPLVEESDAVNAQAGARTHPAAFYHADRPRGTVVESCLDTMILINVCSSLSYRSCGSIN